MRLGMHHCLTLPRYPCILAIREGPQPRGPMRRRAMRRVPHLAPARQADHDEDLLDASDAGPLDEGAAV